MSEESRLGREQIEAAYLLKQLIAAGVRVAYYLEDRERTLDSPTDKILLAVSGFAAEVERDKARQRTYDAMRRKAGAGHVTCPGHKPPRPDLCDPPARSAGYGRVSASGATANPDHHAPPPPCQGVRRVTPHVLRCWVTMTRAWAG